MERSEKTDLNTFQALKQPVAPDLIRQREGWRDRSGNTQMVDYVEWHTVADILDDHAPDWAHTVKDMQEIGDIFTVTVAITIHGITREGIGTGAAGSEMGIKKAEHDALKRAAVKFGVARELYKKESDIIEREGSPSNGFGSDKPQNPVAGSSGDSITDKQLGMIRALGREKKIDEETLCKTEFECRLDELSKKAASYLIKILQEKPAEPSAAIKPQSDNPRAVRGAEIFAEGGVTKKDEKTYEVRAIAVDGSLEVCTVRTAEVGRATCNCDDFLHISQNVNDKFKCEHIEAARAYYAAEHNIAV